MIREASRGIGSYPEHGNMGRNGIDEKGKTFQVEESAWTGENMFSLSSCNENSTFLALSRNL